MPDSDELIARLRMELERVAPDVWPEVRRRVEARHVASKLLAALETPPSPGGRLYWEMRFRLWNSGLRRAG
jgi:hypothetical protein